MQRLALIRYLYTVGVRQSEQPEPAGAMSILIFHDSIELLLQLASEHLDVSTKNASFLNY